MIKKSKKAALFRSLCGFHTISPAASTTAAYTDCAAWHRLQRPMHYGSEKFNAETSIYPSSHPSHASSCLLRYTAESSNEKATRRQLNNFDNSLPTTAVVLAWLHYGSKQPYFSASKNTTVQFLTSLGVNERASERMSAVERAS